MQINMDDSRITSIAQLRDFLNGSQRVVVSLENSSIVEKYQFIEKTVKQFLYQKLKKKDKKIVVLYLRKVTAYKKAQLYKLIQRAQKGSLKRSLYKRVKPHKIYTTMDVKLLEKTDEVHLRLSEDATKKILRREYQIFHNQNYQTISRISHSHISNLRHAPSYRNFWINHTKARQIPIGVTRPPENFGRPGSISD